VFRFGGHLLGDVLASAEAYPLLPSGDEGVCGRERLVHLAPDTPDRCQALHRVPSCPTAHSIRCPSFSRTTPSIPIEANLHPSITHPVVGVPVHSGRLFDEGDRCRL
jgi:hypothetical protein